MCGQSQSHLVGRLSRSAALATAISAMWGAAASAGTYFQLQQIGAPADGTNIVGASLNNNGVVAGTFTDNGTNQAFYWSGSDGHFNSTNIAGGVSNVNGVVGVNDSGLIAGNTTNAPFIYTTNTHVVASLTLDTTYRRNDNTPPSATPYATDLSNSGFIVGAWESMTFTASAASGLQTVTAYPNAPVTNITPVQMYKTSRNGSGGLVGQAVVYNPSTHTSTVEACLTRGGNAEANLGIYYIPGEAGGSWFSAVNDSGTAVGGYYTGAEDFFHNPIIRAFVLRNNVPSNLSNGTGTESGAAAINNAGQIVGSTDNRGSGGPFDPVEYTGGLFKNDGSFVNLNTLIDGSLGYNITRANKINDKGQILATAQYGGQTYSVLLSPLQTPIANGDFSSDSLTGWQVYAGSPDALATVVTDPDNPLHHAVQLTTGSPISIAQTLNTPNSNYSIDFRYELLSGASNWLDVSLDGQQLRRFVLDPGQTGVWLNGAIPVNDPLLQSLDVAELKFTFDGDSSSQLLLSDVGVSVPEPTGVVAMGIVAVGLLRRTRRSGR